MNPVNTVAVAPSEWDFYEDMETGRLFLEQDRLEHDLERLGAYSAKRGNPS